MKCFSRVITILALIYLCTGLTSCSPDKKAHNLEAEVATTLPLLSSEETETTEDWLRVLLESKEEDYGPGTMTPCTNGLLVYYNQSDPRWGDEFYGTSDYMKTHGCGPTAVAMIVASFTPNEVTPLDVGKWASDNGYCSKGEGSLHSLIPDSLTHYGLLVRSMEERTTEAIFGELRAGNIIVVLMNKGYFTNGGHFLLLTQVTEDNKLRIADPASWENTQKTWEPDFILDQVRKKADAGGPLWIVSLPPEE